MLGFDPGVGSLTRILSNGEPTPYEDRVDLETPTELRICDDNLYISDRGSESGHGRLLAIAIAIALALALDLDLDPLD